jgi:hypothetical protein
MTTSTGWLLGGVVPADNASPFFSPFFAIGLDTLRNISLIPALFIVIAAVFAWAVLIRKPRSERPHHHRHHWRTSRSQPVPETKRATKGFLFWRRHRRRRRERPRNPTLAETGGLPGVRGNEPDPPAGLS